MTDVYLERLPEDKVPYWDFSAPGIPDAPRDASAAAVVASALLELSTYLPNGTGKRYKDAAIEMLASLNRFLGTLKEAERSVFLCRYWYLDSTEEIAEKSGFTVSKVKSMLFRIRKRLYAQLTEEGLV